LAREVVQRLGDRIRDGRWPGGEQLPSESALMDEFGVSRTVVREALSQLQAAGLVRTRHGVGTFVIGAGAAQAFQVQPDELATLRDVVALLELRVGVETECAALAAQRRTVAQLALMREALDDFAQAVAAGDDAVAADRRFHLELARATDNPRFAELMTTLGASMIPRARLADPPRSAAYANASPHARADRDYLLRVNAEHEVILQAVARRDIEAARAAMRLHLAHALERRRSAIAPAGGTRGTGRAA
jgi:DNA-binding FadR family transcriptional regulator